LHRSLADLHSTGCGHYCAGIRVDGRDEPYPTASASYARHSLSLVCTVSRLTGFNQGLPRAIFTEPSDPEGARSAEYASMCEFGLQMLFQYDVQDANLITRQLTGIRAFTRYFAYKPDALSPVFQKLLALTTFGANELVRTPSGLRPAYSLFPHSDAWAG
jgi:hypothetical protein